MPRVTVVVSDWGTSESEPATVVRAVAGALALDCEVSIVSLDDRSDPSVAPPSLRNDSLFPIHSLPACDSGARLEAVLRTALMRQREMDDSLPDIVGRHLLDLKARSSDELAGTVTATEPDVVVLGGVEALYLGEQLAAGSRASRPRFVVLPMLGDDPVLSSAAMFQIGEMADMVVALSKAELDRITASVGKRHPDRVARLRVALPMNRSAAVTGLAGMSGFGRYVVLLSRWPDGDFAGQGVAPPHDLVRAAFRSRCPEGGQELAVAEVQGDDWSVTNGVAGFRHEIPWTPNRINFWRLLAGAVAVADLRRPGPFGREVLESLLLGTPVIVPEHSVAAEHARESNGGLWYRSPAELLDELGFLVSDEATRESLSRAGRSWAEREHGEMESFVTQVRHIILGAG